MSIYKFYIENLYVDIYKNDDAIIVVDTPSGFQYQMLLNDKRVHQMKPRDFKFIKNKIIYYSICCDESIIKDLISKYDFIKRIGHQYELIYYKE